MAFIALALASSAPVEATLLDRGNGLIYDDVLNMTWLKYVRYARTSGYAVTAFPLDGRDGLGRPARLRRV